MHLLRNWQALKTFWHDQAGSWTGQQGISYPLDNLCWILYSSHQISAEYHTNSKQISAGYKNTLTKFLMVSYPSEQISVGYQTHLHQFLHRAHVHVNVNALSLSMSVFLSLLLSMSLSLSLFLILFVSLSISLSLTMSMSQSPVPVAQCPNPCVSVFMSMFMIIILNMFMFMDMDKETETDSDPLNMKNASQFISNLVGYLRPLKKFLCGVSDPSELISAGYQILLNKLSWYLS